MTKDCGQTSRGGPITEELLVDRVAKAEEGFELDEILRRRGGRPPMGSSAASDVPVRLDPDGRRTIRSYVAGAGFTGG
ncbi:MAG: CopG family transcriptional regulator [Actinomycetota bacterium]|nr:CopG family transcriptional regulator [Actinomycetota bacterium]